MIPPDVETVIIDTAMIPPDVHTVIIDTGNLLACESFKRKVILAPSGEIIEGVSEVLSKWKESKQEVSDGVLLVSSNHTQPTVTSEERKCLKISVKLFTYTESCSVFSRAMNHVMSVLQVNELDSLTLSPPPDRKDRKDGQSPPDRKDRKDGQSPPDRKDGQSPPDRKDGQSPPDRKDGQSPPDQKDGTIEGLKAVWSCAVANVLNGSIKDLGVSDLDTNQLKELYEWTEEVKPSTNQVNLEACCVIPPEMNEFAQSKDIRLLTHNDPRDFIPSERINTLLAQSGFPDPESWKNLWATRYSVIMTGNGVIKTKGYILAITRQSS